LAVAEGAIVVETDGKSIDEVVAEIQAIVERTWAE
jgi:cytidylate kinase